MIYHISKERHEGVTVVKEDVSHAPRVRESRVAQFNRIDLPVPKDIMKTVL